MNKETLAIGLVLVFLGIVLGYVMLTFYKKQETSPEQPEEKPEVCPVKTLGKVDLTAQVFLGDYGRSVLYLQKQLNEKHQAALDEDGKFGCDTYFAVRKHLGLQPVDGINLMDV